MFCRDCTPFCCTIKRWSKIKWQYPFKKKQKSIKWGTGPPIFSNIHWNFDYEMRDCSPQKNLKTQSYSGTGGSPFHKGNGEGDVVWLSRYFCCSACFALRSSHEVLRFSLLIALRKFWLKENAWILFLFYVLNAMFLFCSMSVLKAVLWRFAFGTLFCSLYVWIVFKHVFVSIFFCHDDFAQTPRFARDPHPPVFLKVFQLRGRPNLAPVVDNLFKVGKTSHPFCFSF